MTFFLLPKIFIILFSEGRKSHSHSFFQNEHGLLSKSTTIPNILRSMPPSPPHPQWGQGHRGSPSPDKQSARIATPRQRTGACSDPEFLPFTFTVFQTADTI